MSRITSFTVSKNIKVPLRQYSTLDTMLSITYEVGEGEAPDFGEAYDHLNQELFVQVGHMDPAWVVEHKDLKDFHKLVLKIPK